MTRVRWSKPDRALPRALGLKRPDEQGSDTRSIGHALSQCQQAWDDAVDHARSLTEKRKLYATILAVLAGLGLFRVQFSVAPNEIPAMGPLTAWTARSCLLTAMGLTVVGVYFLFTENSNVRAWLSRRPKQGPWASLRAWARATGLYRGLPQLGWDPRDPRVAEKESGLGTGRPSNESRRASRFFMLPSDVVRALAQVDEASAIEARIETLRVAYNALCRANRRVGQRIDIGISALGLAFLGIVLAASAYIVGTGGRYERNAEGVQTSHGSEDVGHSGDQDH